MQPETYSAPRHAQIVQMVTGMSSADLLAAASYFVQTGRTGDGRAIIISELKRRRAPQHA